MTLEAQKDSEDLLLDMKESIETPGLLTERERTILQLRFGLNRCDAMTLAEVGKHVGLTQERVRSIQNRAMSKIKEAIDPKPYLLPPRERARPFTSTGNRRRARPLPTIEQQD